jgi:hypothetical protein
MYCLSVLNCAAWPRAIQRMFHARKIKNKK